MTRIRLDEEIITGIIIFHQVGKAEFLGRATGKPHVYLEEEES